MEAQPSPLPLDADAVDVEDTSFEAFFAAEWAPLFRALLLLTGSKQEEEDVTQGPFLKLLERGIGSITEQTLRAICSAPR